MGRLNYYSNYLNNIAKTPNESWRSGKQAFINEMFDNSTVVSNVYEEGYPFDFKFDTNPACWASTIIDVTTGAVKNSDDYRSLYFKDVSHSVGRGRYFKWDNNYWICYETTDSELETISTCNIRRCNNWLKWLTDKGEVVTYPCVIDGDLTSANAQVAKTITQANSHINVIVQGNSDTLSILKNTRIMFNHNVYKFYAINNYMQTDYVDDNAPLLFMDFYLDMEIDEDNSQENLADDARYKYHVECNIKSLTGHKGSDGYIIPKAFYNNNVIEDTPRMEFETSDSAVITIDDSGYYMMKSDGEATITVRILGNEESKTEIPITVTDDTTLTYHLVITPIVTALRQGLSVQFSASIVDNFDNSVDDTITIIDSGTDGHNNYTLVDDGNNKWTLTNELVSRLPLTLTFKNDTYNVQETINIQLKAMF